MKTSSLDRITGLSLRAVCVLALVTVAFVFSVQESPESFTRAENAPPGGLSEINTECWDIASQALIETQKMSTVDDVDSLWDNLMRIRASSRFQHQELFMKLAQAFWNRYVNCVLSRAHGLGRRRSRVLEGNR